ncbi:acyl-CoA thioesterase [Novosphingobium sp. M1R2S20]|uniref:Acyl-CoA thioesterase n=1 Tax=Novosphingobium rhizovicinum TaxID=3228928 RepID=A0ABV3R9P8_9SPHN
MPKPDPVLLAPECYPFTCRIESRFSDLDFNMHINNVSMANLFEEARARFHRAVGYRKAASGLSPMVASVGIEYLGEGAYPDPVDVHVGLEGTGRSSHRVVKLATQAGRVLAFARTVMVTVGPEGPVPLPDEVRIAFEPWKIRT